ncbi:MAG: histidine kinase [Gemmatimonadetes bacterium]|nr:histidine kinase [Gemmatimonadota bacterium]
MERLARVLATWPGRVAAWFVVCTAAGLFFGTQLYYSTAAWGQGATLEWAITVRLWAWYEWGLLLPVVFWLGRRFPLPGARSALVHLVFSVLFAWAQIALNTWTHLTFVAPEEMGYSFRGYFRSLLLFAFHRNLLIYWTMVVGQWVWRTLQELHRQRVAAAELRTQLTQARLDALRLQLHPHFLFNTLNAIQALVRRDPGAAERVVADLSELLRLTLDDVDESLVPLAREVEILDRYVAIQQVRFGDRLRVDLDVPEDLRALLVPPMLLQPVVENAIRHGTASRYDGGQISIRARRAGDRLRVIVEDDGPGLDVPVDVALRKGIGLSNTDERLQRTYGERQKLTLEPREGGGLRVIVEMPVDEVPEEESA